MVGHGGSSAGSYLADPTSPIPSHYASIVVTSTLRVNSMIALCEMLKWKYPNTVTLDHQVDCYGDPNRYPKQKNVTILQFQLQVVTVNG